MANKETTPQKRGSNRPQPNADIPVIPGPFGNPNFANGPGATPEISQEKKEAIKNALANKEKFENAFGKLRAGKKIAPVHAVSEDGRLFYWWEVFQAGGLPVLVQVSPGTLNIVPLSSQLLWGEFVEITDDLI